MERRGEGLLVVCLFSDVAVVDGLVAVVVAIVNGDVSDLDGVVVSEPVQAALSNGVYHCGSEGWKRTVPPAILMMQLAMSVWLVRSGKEIDLLVRM